MWPGTIPTEKDLRKKYGEWVYGDREVLRKKFKNDKHAYRKAKDELRIKTGERYFELNEHAIRHFQTKYSKQPVFERFWLFWGNHFAISEKDFLAEFVPDLINVKLLDLTWLKLLKKWFSQLQLHGV